MKKTKNYLYMCVLALTIIPTKAEKSFDSACPQASHVEKSLEKIQALESSVFSKERVLDLHHMLDSDENIEETPSAYTFKNLLLKTSSFFGNTALNVAYTGTNCLLKGALIYYSYRILLGVDGYFSMMNAKEFAANDVLGQWGPTAFAAGISWISGLFGQKDHCGTIDKVFEADLSISNQMNSFISDLAEKYGVNAQNPIPDYTQSVKNLLKHEDVVAFTKTEYFTLISFSFKYLEPILRVAIFFGILKSDPLKVVFTTGKGIVTCVKGVLSAGQYFYNGCKAVDHFLHEKLCVSCKIKKLWQGDQSSF